MKRIYSCRILAALFLSAFLISAVAFAATAAGDIDNAAPQRGETAWGHLVSDALRNAAGSDVALVNAGSLAPGTLKAGSINLPQIDTLLSFPDDNVVVLPVTGKALRSALELSVRALPAASPAFLHGSGWSGMVNVKAPAGKRVVSLAINGQEIAPDTIYQVAMPVSLAQGANGYFAFWNDSNARNLNKTISTVVADYCRDKGTISPDNTQRIKTAE